MKKITKVQEAAIAASTIPFVPRAERAGRATRECACRRCARPTTLDRETGRWKHEDGTDACVDPETLTEYPNEENNR